jgi:hypothetical protein
MTSAEAVALAEVQCGAKAAACVCTLPPHDEATSHHCQAPNCGGQWIGAYGDDSFDVLRFPGWWSP